MLLTSAVAHAIYVTAISLYTIWNKWPKLCWRHIVKHLLKEDVWISIKIFMAHIHFLALRKSVNGRYAITNLNRSLDMIKNCHFTSEKKSAAVYIILIKRWAALRQRHHSNIMTSSNGNIFRVTGPLCGEFIGPQWIPRTKASDAKLWYFLWSAPEKNGWVNNGEAGDLRRHRAHYDVILMMQLWPIHLFRLYESFNGC